MAVAKLGGRFTVPLNTANCCRSATFSSATNRVSTADQLASISETTPRSPGRRLSTQELQRPRDYLARPETQEYLRVREVLHTRTPQPREAVAIEARHVATVFRELAGERGSRSVSTPATAMRVPSTKRVMEAAVAVANVEGGAANRLGVTAQTGRGARFAADTRPRHWTWPRVAVTENRRQLGFAAASCGLMDGPSSHSSVAAGWSLRA
jgi:hypothetical protein